jgi:histone-binding protein RBBP4
LSKHPSFPKEDDSPFCPQGVCIGHTKEGYGLCWSPHKEGHLVTASEDRTLRLWDVNAITSSKSNSGTQIKAVSTFSGHRRVVEDVDWHKRDPNMIGSVGDDQALHIWDVRGKDPDEPVHYVSKAHKSDINCLAFNPINEYVLATGGADNIINVWDLRNLDK